MWSHSTQCTRLSDLVESGKKNFYDSSKAPIAFIRRTSGLDLTWVDQVKENHYGELYEEKADGRVSLEETLVELIDALESETDYRLTHFRYVYMGMVLALAVVPTIEAYLSKDKILLVTK